MKNPMDRVTLMTCSNATDTHKFPLFSLVRLPYNILHQIDNVFLYL